ncbi:MAG: phosphatase PAP2 family protein [bacterium]
MPTLPYDLSAFRWLNGLAGTSHVFDFAAVVAAKWLIYVLAAAVLLAAVVSVSDRLWGGRRSRGVDGPVIAVRSLVAVALSAVDSAVLAMILFRERPFVSLDGVRLLVDPPLLAKSFPSDHATLAFALAVSVLMVNRRYGLPALAVAVLVAVGRVAVGVHFPLDVLAGALLGTAWAAVVGVVGNWYGDRQKISGRLVRRSGSEEANRSKQL